MPVVRRVTHHRLIPKGVLLPGDEVVAINGHLLRDVIDVRFHSAEERVELLVRRPDGTETSLRLAKQIDADLGIEFEPDRIRTCRADCDFCFVRQQPKRTLRKALYIRDDDYRLSFLHGNFVTLTNLTEEDYARIFAQRLSPLYVSVHSTDDAVRRAFLHLPDAEPVIPLLKRLHAHGIRTHTQIVVTPGINDGEVLWRSFDDLLKLYPNVPSVGVVPVGLTRFREDLPPLSLVTPAQARAILRQIDKRHQKMRRRYAVGGIYAADEMFLLAEQAVPSAEYYDEYPQFENGIGMVRRLLDGYAAGEGTIPRRLARRLHLCVITGSSAAPFISDLCERVTRKVKNLSVTPLVVSNDFWGPTVTVSGLLTGGDIAAQFTNTGLDVDAVVIPPNCLNDDGLFLDDLTVPELAERLEKPVLESEYDFAATVVRALAGVRSARAGHMIV